MPKVYAASPDYSAARTLDLLPDRSTAGHAEGFADIHMHGSNYVQRGPSVGEVVSYMDELGVRYTTWMPIPTTVRRVLTPQGQEISLLDTARGSQKGSPTAHHCGAVTYYIPRTLEDKWAGHGEAITIEHLKAKPEIIEEIISMSKLYVDTGVNGSVWAALQSAISKNEITPEDRERIDPMATGFDLADDRCGEKLLAVLRDYPGTFTGVGEITLHKELVQDLFADQGGQASVNEPHKLAGLLSLLEMAGVLGMPVVLHCDIDDLRAQLRQPRSDSAPAYLAGLQKLFEHDRLKGTNIIWAHGGGLGRFVQPGHSHLDDLQDLLDKCPRLNIDISWDKVAQQIISATNKNPLAPLGPDHAEPVNNPWVEFVERNHKRVLYGSDALAPGSAGAWNRTKNLYSKFLDKLTPPAREAVLLRNYERLVVDARPRIRAIETVIDSYDFRRRLGDTASEDCVLSAEEMTRWIPSDVVGGRHLTSAPHRSEEQRGESPSAVERDLREQLQKLTARCEELALRAGVPAVDQD